MLYSQAVPHPALKFQELIPLAPYTTFRIGGPARFFCKVTTETELREAVTFARSGQLPLFVLGGGSNLLVSDEGFPGLVIQAAITGAVNVQGGYVDGPRTKTPLTYHVPAGFDWNAFVLMTAEAGISGIECLAGIPGLVGGSPIQNIGAYGQEVSSSISVVRALDLETLSFVDLPADRCQFAYRRSIFNTTHRNRYIVTSVTFQLDVHATPKLTYADLQHFFTRRDTLPKPIDIYHAVREIRHRKGMLIVEGEPDSRSAGSFFKNPVVPSTKVSQVATQAGCLAEDVPRYGAGEGMVKLPAAWLVERAGFHKGFAMGRAAISSRHTLALVNLGDATAAELIALRDAVMKAVEDKFSVHLEQEPVMLGFSSPH